MIAINSVYLKNEEAIVFEVDSILTKTRSDLLECRMLKVISNFHKEFQLYMSIQAVLAAVILVSSSGDDVLRVIHNFVSVLLERFLKILTFPPEQT